MLFLPIIQVLLLILRSSYYVRDVLSILLAMFSSYLRHSLIRPFLPFLKASPQASTLEAMGRKEDDDCSSWKKQTTNIRKTFIFMEVLGS